MNNNQTQTLFQTMDRRQALKTAAVTAAALGCADDVLADENGQPLRIGIMGMKGGHHRHILEGARELGNAKIVGISDENEKSVAALARREPLASDAKLFGDWRKLVEDVSMDVCFVSDENGMRAEQLLALLERGIDIVAEKPLTTTLKDLARVREAIAQSKSHLTMMLTQRHEGKYVTMRKLIAAGRIGKVRLATSQKSYRLGERAEWQKHRDRLGGVIPFIGIHAMDLMRWITGLDYTRVAAFHSSGAVAKMKETEDSATVLLQFKGGGTASSRLDYLRPMTAPTHGDDRLRIAGTEGVIEALGHEPHIRLLSAKGRPEQIEPEPSDNLFASFIRAIREKKKPRIPVDDCLYITDVVLQARRAADEQKMIELKG